MSRTKAHTPYHVLERRAKDSQIVHNGCHLDPRGASRLVRWELVDIREEADWIPKEKLVNPRPFGHRVRYLFNAQTLRYEPQETDPFPVRSYFRVGSVQDENGVEQIFSPLIRTERVPVYEVVDCDVDDPTGPYRSCHYESDDASVTAYGYHHKCFWPNGLKRDLWYSPERQQAREFCREAAAQYNTHGDAPEDEPYTPGSPRGLWGGGWVD